MKLLQDLNFDHLETLTEQTSSGKVLYIEGPFLMCNAQNRNGRVYPRSVMEAAVDRYQREYINERRAIGELTHPNYPMPNPREAALITESLTWQGDNVIGKARILNNPFGQQIKSLLEANFKMGVSSRGLGDVKKRGQIDEVSNFFLNAIDAVDMPSGQVCYVNPVNESTNWVMKDGIWVTEATEEKESIKLDIFLEAFKEMLHSFKMPK